MNKRDNHDLALAMSELPAFTAASPWCGEGSNKRAAWRDACERKGLTTPRSGPS